jgi:hypothetical protein
LWVMCVVRYKSLRRADHLSRGVLPSVVCVCGRKASAVRRPWPTGRCYAKGGKNMYFFTLTSLHFPLSPQVL